MPVEMKIQGLMFDPVTKMPIIILKGLDGKFVLPIWVGHCEADAIAVKLEEVACPRPMTHDLLRDVIHGLRAQVRRVVITDLKDHTFFALVHLDHEGQDLAIDARPSDAMALALRAEAPIFVESEVLEKSESSDDPAAAEAERLRRWLETVDPEELGKYEM